MLTVGKSIGLDSHYLPMYGASECLLPPESLNPNLS